MYGMLALTKPQTQQKSLIIFYCSTILVINLIMRSDIYDEPMTYRGPLRSYKNKAGKQSSKEAQPAFLRRKLHFTENVTKIFHYMIMYSSECYILV